MRFARERIDTVEPKVLNFEESSLELSLIHISSLKMMRLQPKVDAIKRKYANLKVTDPKRSEMNLSLIHI